MRKAALILIFLTSAAVSFAQPLTSKLIKGNKDSYLSIIPTYDNGFLLTGITDNSTVISKFDNNLVQVWRKTLEGVYSGGVLETSTHEIMLQFRTCDTPTNTSVQNVMKLDANGNLIWIKSFINYNSCSSAPTPGSVIETSDGKYACFTYNYSFDAVKLTVLDTSGNLLSSKVITTGNGFIPTQISAVPGGIRMVGYDDIAGIGANTVAAVNCDNSGQVQSGKMYSNNIGGDLSWSTNCGTSDGGIFWYFQMSGGKKYCFRTDANGNIQPLKQFSDRYNLRQCIPADNGSVYAFGSYSFTAPVRSVSVLSKIDSTGKVLWAKSYAYENRFARDYYYEQPSNTVVMIMSDYVSNPGRTVLVRTSLDTVLHCNEEHFDSLAIIPSAYTISAQNAFSNNSVTTTTFASKTYNVFSLTNEDSLICSSVAVGSRPRSPGFEIFPNPTSGSFTVRNSFSGIASMSIYDITGNLVYTQQLTGRETRISGLDLQKGIYIIRLANTEQTVMQRMLIE